MCGWIDKKIERRCISSRDLSPWKQLPLTRIEQSLHELLIGAYLAASAGEIQYNKVHYWLYNNGPEQVISCCL